MDAGKGVDDELNHEKYYAEMIFLYSLFTQTWSILHIARQGMMIWRYTYHFTITNAVHIN